MSEGVHVSGSLRTRLMFALIGGAAVFALLLFLLIRGYAQQVAQQGQDNILSASVTSILDAASVRNGTLEVDIPFSSFSMLNTPSDDRVFYSIFQDGAFLSGYEELSPASAVRGDQIEFATQDFRGDTIRVATASRILIGSGVRTVVTVALAQTQGALAVTLRQISETAALSGIAFFMLAVALSLWTANFTIGPIRNLATSVARRGPKDLRTISSPVPSEMQPLVTSLNSLIGRLDHSLKQSEDFIAEAAHRVRTPLATVRSHAEATLQRVDKPENREALRTMVRAIDESSRAAGQLLDHAMITFRADNLERQDIDLAGLVQDLVDRMTPLADMNDIDLRFTASGAVPYSGDPILLQSAIRNVLDNALKYAPGDSEVDIRVTAEPQTSVVIGDCGPGFSLDEIGDLAMRFRRGQNAKGTTGSGLGLTIAQDVAAAHGGRLELTQRDGGGACVSLHL